MSSIKQKNIVLIEPFFTGSHQSWAEGYKNNSQHNITIISLKGIYWKWRMHGGAITLAKMFNEHIKQNGTPDLIFITVGTPVDEYSNPKIKLFLSIIENYKKFFTKEQIIIIRSSVFPNICMHVNNILGRKTRWNIAYCPERILQGYSIRELSKLPQIISGFTKKSIVESEKLFKKITNKTVISTVKEAELAKLFTNSLRYIQFAMVHNIIVQSIWYVNL